MKTPLVLSHRANAAIDKFMDRWAPHAHAMQFRRDLQHTLDAWQETVDGFRDYMRERRGVRVLDSRDLPDSAEGSQGNTVYDRQC
jgi:hypothetical protein